MRWVLAMAVAQPNALGLMPKLNHCGRNRFIGQPACATLEVARMCTQEEQVAVDLVREAAAQYEKVLSPAALQRLQDRLVDELLCTFYGRARLRRLMPDPVSNESAELTRPDAESSQEEEKKRGESEVSRKLTPQEQRLCEDALPMVLRLASRLAYQALDR